MSGYTVRCATIVWETCPKCGRAFPNAYPCDGDGNITPGGVPVGHKTCPVKAPNPAPSR